MSEDLDLTKYSFILEDCSFEAPSLGSTGKINNKKANEDIPYRTISGSDAIYIPDKLVSPLEDDLSQTEEFIHLEQLRRTPTGWHLENLKRKASKAVKRFLEDDSQRGLREIRDSYAKYRVLHDSAKLPLEVQARFVLMYNLQLPKSVRKVFHVPINPYMGNSTDELFNRLDKIIDSVDDFTITQLRDSYLNDVPSLLGAEHDDPSNIFSEFHELKDIHKWYNKLKKLRETFTQRSPELAEKYGVNNVLFHSLIVIPYLYQFPSMVALQTPYIEDYKLPRSREEALHVDPLTRFIKILQILAEFSFDRLVEETINEIVLKSTTDSLSGDRQFIFDSLNECLAENGMPKMKSLLDNLLVFFEEEFHRRFEKENEYRSPLSPLRLKRSPLTPNDEKNKDNSFRTNYPTFYLMPEEGKLKAKPTKDDVITEQLWEELSLILKGELIIRNSMGIKLLEKYVHFSKYTYRQKIVLTLHFFGDKLDISKVKQKELACSFGVTDWPAEDDSLASSLGVPLSWVENFGNVPTLTELINMIWSYLAGARETSKSFKEGSGMDSLPSVISAFKDAGFNMQSQASELTSVIAFFTPVEDKDKLSKGMKIMIKQASGYKWGDLLEELENSEINRYSDL